jgi:hypothetical protein
MCQSPQLGDSVGVNSDFPAGLEFISQTVSTLPVTAASSTGRRNTCVKFTRWSLEAQSFSRALI